MKIDYDYFKNSGMDKSMENRILVESTGVINSVGVRSPSHRKNLCSNPSPQHELCSSQPCTAHSCVLLHHHLPAEVTNTAMQTDPILHLPPLFLHPCAAPVVKVAAQDVKRFPLPIPPDVVKAAPAKKQSPLVLPDVSEDADVGDKNGPASVSKNVPLVFPVVNKKVIHGKEEITPVVPVTEAVALVANDVPLLSLLVNKDFVDVDDAPLVEDAALVVNDADEDVADEDAADEDDAQVEDVVAQVATVVEIAVQDGGDYDVAQYNAVYHGARLEDYAHVIDTEVVVQVVEADVEDDVDYVTQSEDEAHVTEVVALVADVANQDAVESDTRVAHATENYAPVVNVVDDDDLALVNVADQDVVADYHKKEVSLHAHSAKKITLEDVLRTADPVVKSTLRVYQTGASYLSNRTRIGKKSTKVSDLLASAHFLKDLNGSTSFPKDKVGLVNYVVDRLDQALKQQFDTFKCHTVTKACSADHFNSSPMATSMKVTQQATKKKPLLLIKDSRKKFTKDSQSSITEVGRLAIKSTDIARTNQEVTADSRADDPVRKCKTSKDMKKNMMALKQDKNNKLVSTILAQKRKDVTGGLLELASSEESTNLLMRYSTRESDVKNISAFKSYSYQKLPLQMTFKDVMGSAAPPELEKKEMATRIVERINAMLPIFCCKCSDFYCELDQKETSIKCFQCETVAHKICLDQEINCFDSDRGYVWLCYQCLVKPVISGNSRFRYMDETVKKQCDHQIGILLGNIKGSHAATIMVQSYSLDMADSYNVGMLMKNDKPMIERAYRTLMSIPGEQELKTSNKDMVTDIIEVIKKKFPRSCGTCRESYSSATGETTSEVACHKCKTLGHRGCHTDRLADVEIGAVWLCTGCMEEVIGNEANLVKLKGLQGNPYYCRLPVETGQVKVKKSQDNNPKPKDKYPLSEEFEPKSPSVASQQETPVSSASQFIKDERLKAAGRKDSVQPDNESPGQRSSQESHQHVQTASTWCPDLLKGVCPYGWTGSGCSYYHPKRCIKFCKSGSIRHNAIGCPYGGRCRFFHPELCENSLKLGKCLVLDCRRVHLVGTARPTKKGERAHHEHTEHDRSIFHPEKPHLKRQQAINTDIRNSNQQPFDYLGRSHVKPDFSDPASFLVLRLEGLKASLTTLQREIAALQDCLNQQAPYQQNQQRRMSQH